MGLEGFRGRKNKAAQYIARDFAGTVERTDGGVSACRSCAAPSRFDDTPTLVAQLVADRYTFLSLGQVIGSGVAEDLGGEDIRRLMAGGAQMADREEELAAIH